MSVGNYLGGVVADRHASPRTLGIIFVAGSVSCLLILVITDLVIGQTWKHRRYDLRVLHRRIDCRHARIRSFNEDARTFLMEWADPQQYDIVFGDAFNDLSIPYHLTTVEFNRIIDTRLKPDGIYLVNVIDKFEDGEFLKAYANGLRAIFPHVYVFGRGTAFQPFDRNTYVLMASRRPLDREFEALAAAQSDLDRTTPLDEERLNHLPEIRTSTHADRRLRAAQLLARLFIERGN